MQRTSVFQKEKGAALVVGIVLLVVSTLLALVATQSSLFQERMASNQYNKTISLMAAEYGAGALLEEVTSAGYDPAQDLTQWQQAVVGSEGSPISAGAGDGFYWVQLLSHIDTPDPGDPLRLAVHGVSRIDAGGANLGRTRLNLEIDVVTFPPGGGESDDAAINFIQPITEYRAPNSNSYTVTGAQEDGLTAGPAIGVSTDYDSEGNPLHTDRDALIAALGPDGVDRLDNYDGGIVSKDFGDFWNNERLDSHDGTTPLYSEALSTTQSALQQFVNQVCVEANDPAHPEWTGVSRCGTSVPEHTTGRGKDKTAAMVPKITVVRGDAHVDFGGGAVGAGLLIVEGDLYMNGNPSWDGIIITLGGTIDVSGGGNGVFNGTIYSLDMDTTADPWSIGSDGVNWINRGGGTAAYNHNCDLVEAALNLLEDPAYDGDPAYNDGTGLAVNARAIFGDNHGCGPAGAGPGAGELDPRTEYVFRWIEVEN